MFFNGELNTIVIHWYNIAIKMSEVMNHAKNYTKRNIPDTADHLFYVFFIELSSIDKSKKIESGLLIAGTSRKGKRGVTLMGMVFLLV